jgi:hypothetical protein
MSVRIIAGPPTSKVSKQVAEEKLTSSKDFPEGASYAIQAVEGRWVAAFTTTASPEDEFGAPSGPPSDGPDTPPEIDGPDAPAEDGPPKDDSESGDDKPKGDKDKGEKGGELSKIEHMLTTLLTALGLGDPTDSPVPGHDAPHEAPPGPPVPPVGPEGTGADGKTHTVHERALKPGEAPPGTTPVGSPAFASTNPDHPWADVIGVKRTFVVEDEIEDDTKLASINAELSELAKGTGYEVKQLREGSVNGRRTARALISKK